MKIIEIDAPDIVIHAMNCQIVDIGQLSKSEKRVLDSYCKKGYLVKYRGGLFPAIKTVYACHPTYLQKGL